MSSAAVSDSYASTLLELAGRHEVLEESAEALGDVVALYESEPDFRLFLDTPRVGVEKKREALRASLEGRVPDLFLRFLLVVLDKGRQRALPAIGQRFRELLNEREERLRATVTLPFEADAALEDRIRERLSELFERDVRAVFRVDPAVLGGIVVRLEDRVMDGSLRRRLRDLRRELERSSA